MHGFFQSTRELVRSDLSLALVQQTHQDDTKSVLVIRTQGDCLQKRLLEGVIEGCRGAKDQGILTRFYERCPDN